MNQVKFCFALFILLAGCAGKDPVSPEAQNLQAAQNFTLKDPDGNAYSLDSFPGQVVVLKFFATWCAPCQEEMPKLEKNIWQAYQSKGVAVLGVDYREDIGQVKLYAVNNGYTFPLVIDTSGGVFLAYRAGDAGNASTSGFFTVVIDKDRKIRFSKRYDEAAMIPLIEELNR